MPGRDHGVRGHPQHAAEGHLGPARGARGLEDAPHHVVTPAPRNVRPQRLTVAVGEEARVGELLGRRKLVPHCVAHPHRCVGVDGAHRQVLGHAFHEPQRVAHDRRYAGHYGAAALARDVELERVHQLVTQHVVGLGERAREREHYTALEDLGHAAGALADAPLQRIGLAEVGPARVQDQGLASGQVVVEQAGESRVPALRHERGVLYGDLFLRVEVDIEVLGLEHLEIQALILHLVLTEVLRLGPLHGHQRSGAHERRTGQERQLSGQSHQTPRGGFCCHIKTL